MAEVQPPLFVDVNGQLGADALGLPHRDLFAEGVLAAGDLAPSAPGGMAVRIAKGAAWVKGDDDADKQPTYRVRNDGNVDLNLAAADATNPRIDRVIARVYDATFAGASLKWQLEVVQGAPTAGATLANLLGAGAVPNTALLVANVLVPAGAAALVAGDIGDVRSRASLGLDIGAADGQGMMWDAANGRWKAGQVGGLVKLWDSTEAGVVFPVASIVTPALPQTYKHLRIVSKLVGSGGASDLYVRCNGDAGGNYQYGVLLAFHNQAPMFTDGSGVTAGYVSKASSASGNSPGHSVVTLHDYARTGYARGGVFQTSARDGNATGGHYTAAGAWWWENTADPVSSLTFLLQSGNLAAGSRITVYGEA